MCVWNHQQANDLIYIIYFLECLFYNKFTLFGHLPYSCIVVLYSTCLRYNYNQFIFVIKLQIFIVYQGCPRNACTFSKAPMSAPDYGDASAHNFGMPQLTVNHLPQKKVSLLCFGPGKSK